MVRRGLLLALVAVCMAVSAQVASADPINAKNAQLITAVCGDQTLQVSVNGNGEFTPAHVVGTSAMFIPTAFDVTFSFTPTGGETMSEHDTSAKHNQPANVTTCDLPLAANTSTNPFGTFSISGSVTGFFTPANG
jgi:hypothetical protein